MNRIFFLLSLVLVAMLVGCGDNSEEVILATTTSTQDSGLLDVLVPQFEEESGYEVKVIAVGSGQALRLGEEGEADVILAHSPKAEEEFVAAGFGVERQAVMHNDFVIVGPADDPAGVKGTGDAAAALAAIEASGETFVSRGDESGTHTKELSLWESAGVEPSGDWYTETGQGMGATLGITNDRQGYTLTDRGTFLAQEDSLDLEIVSEGDPALFNNYHVMVVNPEKHSDVNADGARAFAAFVTSPGTQVTIGSFGAAEYGESLFVPDANVQRQESPTTEPSSGP
jgi:tungstate transport system substrate-binding protein